MPPDTAMNSYTPQDDGFAAVDLSQAGYDSDSWSSPTFVDYGGNGKRGDRIPLTDRKEERRTRSRFSDDMSEYDDPYMDDIEQPFENGVLGGLKQTAKRQAKRYARKPWFLMCGLGFVLVLVILASVASNGPLPTPEEPENVLKPPNITLSHALNNTFGAHYSYYRWAHGVDGTFFVRRHSTVLLKHVESGNETVILENVQDPNGNHIEFRDFLPSNDLQFVLLETEYEKGWRHSFFANYWVWDVATKKAEPLTTSKSDKIIPGEIGSGKVSLALWSPSGHHVAWVRDNDLYVTVDAKTEVRITTDGSKDIINGIADWVYEEEVLASHDAMWFSPAGTHIAYLKFNETQVLEYHFQYYEKSHQTPYPDEVSVKYPKAGQPNPIVTLHIATPSSPNATGLNVPVEFDSGHYFEDGDRLIVEVVWVSEESILVRMVNRVQDSQRLFLVESHNIEGVAKWTGKLIRDEMVSDGGWINRLQPIVLIPPSKAVGRQNPSYVELMEDEKGYTHLAYFSAVADPKPTTWLTSGLWEVAEVVGVDGEKGIIYFISTEEGASQRHLYSVHLDGSSKQPLTPPKNVTWDKTLPEPIFYDNGTNIVTSGGDRTRVGFYSAKFSPDCGYYLLQYTGPDIPWSRVVKSDGTWFKAEADNQHLRESIPKYAMPRTSFIQIPRAADAQENARPIAKMNMKLTVPYDFDPNSNKQYPVLLRVYGGPNSQLVQQRYSVDFMTAMSSAGGFITAVVDGRGTGFMGRAFRTAVASQLGSLEVDDQITAAKWLGQQSYVDKTRIAIWGWSYGGYMTSKVVEADSGVFALGMAVAPVTDWRYYDSIYTERYMKTPAMNPTGYEKSAVTKMDGFRKTKFLLVHGTADDNVHFQNSASLIWRLTGARVRKYRVQVYVDSDHSMSAGGANREIWVLLWDFIMEAFRADSTEYIILA